MLSPPSIAKIPESGTSTSAIARLRRRIAGGCRTECDITVITKMPEKTGTRARARWSGSHRRAGARSGFLLKIRARNVSGHEASLLAERKPFRARLRRSRGRKWRPAFGNDAVDGARSEIAPGGSLRTPRRPRWIACGRSGRLGKNATNQKINAYPGRPLWSPALHIFSTIFD